MDKMDTKSRLILRNTMRFLANKGYQIISEFALPNKKRVDLIAINLKREILIVEVKSNIKNLKIDKKWKKYLKYCNFFYFALNNYQKVINIKKNIGIIKTNNLKTEIIQKPKYNKISIKRKSAIILKFALSAASKFHRLIDPNFKKQKNNSIFIYKKKI